MGNWHESYGLDMDPFAEGGVQGLFYPGAGRQETVEQMLHLARFSHHLLVVSGPPGAGKTAVARHFLSHCPADARCCLVEAAILDTPESLLRRILGGFGVFPAGQASLATDLRQFETLCTESREARTLLWIVIDDAQHLNPETLALLPQLLRLGAQAPHLVLVADTQWVPRFRAQLPADVNAHVFELAPFNRGETYAYIHYRLKTAGLEGEPPFSPKELESIHADTGGVPARINAFARQLLDDAAGTAERPLANLPMWHIGVVTATLIALVLLYFWTSAAEEREVPLVPVPRATVAASTDADVPGEIAEPVSAMPGAEPTGATDARAPTEQTASDGAAAGAAPPVAQDVAAPRKPAPASADEDEVDSATADATTLQSAAVKSPEPPVRPRAETVVKAEPPPAARPPQAPMADADPPGRKPGADAKIGSVNADEKFLLGLPPTRFTIQVMASDNLAGVDRFVARNSDIPLRRVRKLSRGKEWVLLVSGDYATRAEANAALRRIAPRFSAEKPWVRPLGEVHAQIRARGTQPSPP